MILPILEYVRKTVTIYSDDHYEAFGRTRRISQDIPITSDALRGQSPILLERLALDLYSHVFSRPWDSEGADSSPNEDSEALHVLPPLRALTPQCGTVESTQPDGVVTAWFGTARVSLLPGRYNVPAAFGRAAHRGEAVTLPSARRGSDVQAGWNYTVIGVPEIADRPGHLCRIYFALKSENTAGANGILQDVEHFMVRHACSVTIKQARGQSGGPRLDGIILYISPPALNRVREPLSDVLTSISGRLQAPVPLFSRQILPGIGYAEDPSSGESFGLDRCRRVARALWDAPDVSAEKLLERVSNEFAQDGLDIEKPWRNGHTRPRPVICGTSC